MGYSESFPEYLVISEAFQTTKDSLALTSRNLDRLPLGLRNWFIDSDH